MSIIFGVFPFGVVRKLLYHYYATLFLSYAEKAQIMQMWMLANNVDPYHCILSDALLREEKR